MDVGNLTFGSTAFSKSSLYIWKISVHVLLKPQFSSVTQSCLTLCDVMPDSSVHGTSQAKILEWVAISFSKESSQPRA